jgi:hypothetical protein
MPLIIFLHDLTQLTLNLFRLELFPRDLVQQNNRNGWRVGCGLCHMEISSTTSKVFRFFDQRISFVEASESARNFSSYLSFQFEL